MRNICRRIEALENATSVKRNLEVQIGEKVMDSFWPNDAEDLLRAYGAQRAGRPLTESEAPSIHSSLSATIGSIAAARRAGP
jgi:hypothetical protein